MKTRKLCHKLKSFHFQTEKDLTFEVRDGVTRFHGTNVQLFGPSGPEKSWKPSFHVSGFLNAPFVHLINILKVSD